MHTLTHQKYNTIKQTNNQTKNKQKINQIVNMRIPLTHTFYTHTQKKTLPHIKLHTGSGGGWHSHRHRWSSSQHHTDRRLARTRTRGCGRGRWFERSRRGRVRGSGGCGWCQNHFGSFIIVKIRSQLCSDRRRRHHIRNRCWGHNRRGSDAPRSQCRRKVGVSVSVSVSVAGVRYARSMRDHSGHRTRDC